MVHNIMNYFVYVLKNHKGELYIGQTNNVGKRLIRHNSGMEKSTRNKGPYELIYQERFLTRSEAIKREKRLKFGKGREWIKKTLL